MNIQGSYSYANIRMNRIMNRMNECITKNHITIVFPANNGEPFRFRIGSVKSVQLFQLSAENFFRLRYESVPLQ